MKKKKKKTTHVHHQGHTSEKSDSSSGRASGRCFFRRHSTPDIVSIGGDSSVRVTAPEDLPVGQGVEVEDSDVDDPDPG